MNIFNPILLIKRENILKQNFHEYFMDLIKFYFKTFCFM